MNDELSRLEQEMAVMKLRVVPVHVTRRIAAELSPYGRVSWSDRILASAMCAGALAACVIATLLIRPSASSVPGAPIISARQPGPAEELPLVARLDARWADLLSIDWKDKS